MKLFRGLMMGPTAGTAGTPALHAATWGRVDWLSDAIPHLVYGLVKAMTLRRLTEEG